MRHGWDSEFQSQGYSIDKIKYRKGEKYSRNQLAQIPEWCIVRSLYWIIKRNNVPQKKNNKIIPGPPSLTFFGAFISYVQDGGKQEELKCRIFGNLSEND